MGVGMGVGVGVGMGVGVGLGMGVSMGVGMALAWASQRGREGGHAATATQSHRDSQKSTYTLIPRPTTTHICTYLRQSATFTLKVAST